MHLRPSEWSRLAGPRFEAEAPGHGVPSGPAPARWSLTSPASALAEPVRAGPRCSGDWSGAHRPPVVAGAQPAGPAGAPGVDSREGPAGEGRTHNGDGPHRLGTRGAGSRPEGCGGGAGTLLAAAAACP